MTWLGSSTKTLTCEWNYTTSLMILFDRLSLSGTYLHSSGHSYGRPIADQREISAYAYTDNNNLWKAMVSGSASFILLF